MTHLRGRRVLVWGACGFMGRYLVPALLDTDARVSVLTYPPDVRYPLPWAEKVQWFRVPRQGRCSSIYALALAEAEVVYHLAGNSGAVDSNRDPIASLHNTCLDTLDFLITAARIGTRPRVVFASSRLVYGATGDRAADENHPLSAGSIYAAHKIAVENYLNVYAACADITFTICRISNPFGFDPNPQRKSYGILNHFVERAVAGHPIQLFGAGLQRRDFIHISDLIRALLLASGPAAKNAVFNVGSGQTLPLIEAARKIAELTGTRPLVELPWPDEVLAVETGDSLLDVTRIATVLGFSPQIGFQEGIAATVAEYSAASPHRDGLTARGKHKACTV